VNPRYRGQNHGNQRGGNIGVASAPVHVLEDIEDGIEATPAAPAVASTAMEALQSFGWSATSASVFTTSGASVQPRYLTAAPYPAPPPASTLSARNARTAVAAVRSPAPAFQVDTAFSSHAALAGTLAPTTGSLPPGNLLLPSDCTTAAPAPSHSAAAPQAAQAVDATAESAKAALAALQRHGALMSFTAQQRTTAMAAAEVADTEAQLTTQIELRSAVTAGAAAAQALVAAHTAALESAQRRLQRAQQDVHNEQLHLSAALAAAASEQSKAAVAETSVMKVQTRLEAQQKVYRQQIQAELALAAALHPLR
jgi:hypothetical protein